jgi:predicted DNA-binding protein
MKRRTIHLSSSQHGRLAKLSKETGAPVAEIIRRAVDEHLEKRTDLGPPGDANAKSLHKFAESAKARRG